MLKIQDEQGKDLFVIKDDATQPEKVGEIISAPEPVVEETTKEEKE